MRSFRWLLLLSAAFTIQKAEAQIPAPAPVKMYKHKVEVAEILQTKNYTYLNVKEQIAGKDSLIWLALPKFEPAVGNVFYYESGLQMGEFHSTELDRTFNDIVFLGSLSTTAEISEKTMISALPANQVDTTQQMVALIRNVEVLEVLQTSSYTYLRVKEGDKEEWLASTKVVAKKGDFYNFDDAAEMTNFTSKELKRTFPSVLFVAKLKEGKAEQAPTKESHALSTPDMSSQDLSATSVMPIETIEGIQTVAKIWNQKEAFDGKLVTVKGKVTRYSSNILSSNWIHIEDGTSTDKNKDLTVTTSETFKVGDEVTIEGVVRLHRDFGSGYLYELLLEGAKKK